MPRFNEVTDEHLVKYLNARADGKCIVDMKKVFSNVTLQVISWVRKHIVHVFSKSLIL